MTVYLVGAGPGDPGLLTLRAAELLSRADVVLHDRLVPPGALALVGKTALVLDVGKRAGRSESAEQKVINELLVEHGRQAKVVVRLKGGDPYIFGRGGEEALALEEAGIAYEVVPGVSSIAAVPAAAGVPLTMRGVSSAVVVVTGHDVEAAEGSGGTFSVVARTDATLVILMGSSNRAAIAERLIAAGRPEATPVLAVADGTTSEQHSVRTTLGELGKLDLAGTVTFVVGAVAALALASYEDRPLHGWTVVVTRAEPDGSPLERELRSAGASTVALPSIVIGPPADGGAALRAALGRPNDFAWVVLSSTHGVEALFREVRDARALAGMKVAVIGRATAEACQRHGIEPDLVPLRFVAEGLLEVFPPPIVPGEAVLLPGSDRARETLATGLRALGYSVTAVHAYRTTQPAVDGRLTEQLRGAQAVTFASPSAVEGFVSMVGREAVPPVVITIGPVTSAAVRDAGLEVAAEATEHTVAGLLRAILELAGHTEPPLPG